MSGGVVRSALDKIDECLADGRTPSRLIVRGDDLAGLGCDGVSHNTFLGIPVVSLGKKDVIVLWGMTIARGEDVAELRDACERQGIIARFMPIGPGGCFLLTERFMGEAG